MSPLCQVSARVAVETYSSEQSQPHSSSQHQSTHFITAPTSGVDAGPVYAAALGGIHVMASPPVTLALEQDLWLPAPGLGA